jgi:uncharacterized protein (DUF433 family)/DNA-binding transcriptional MerR regulator
MSTATERGPELGVGIYSFPAAARLVGEKPRKLHYWMESGLTPPSYKQARGQSDVLSFHDLLSLEMVKRIRSFGVTLQKIRLLESELRRYNPSAPRPFALEVFFTDGVDIWYQLEPNDQRLVQATGKHRRHVAWRDAVASFAHEIVYDDGIAVRWHPEPYVSIDPRVHFGEPVVQGTKVSVTTIAANLKAGTPEQVARWFDLTLDQVQAAGAYAAEIYG